MTRQSASAAGLIVPGFFGFNLETSRTNIFQQQAAHSNDIHQKALAELMGAYEIYKAAGIEIHLFESTDLTLPDAVFPNSVVTFAGAELPFGEESKHYAILCPMLESSRQRERDPYASFLKDTLKYELVERDIFERDIHFYEAQDLSGRQALEGTGSLALDRVNRVAYCALSPRSDAELAAQFCRAIGYELVTFNTENNIYHTDLVMFIGTGYAVVCSAVIHPSHRSRVLSRLRESGLTVYDVGLAQFKNFCLNSREISDRSGNKFVFMSSNAYRAFDPATLKSIRSHGVEILHAPLDTIELYGGGSGCCITQELHGL